MNKFQAKKAGLERRKRRVRGKVTGTADRPRLAVHRTNAHIYAQVIDDVDGKTICAASTLDPEFRATGSWAPTRRPLPSSASSSASAPSRRASPRSALTAVAVSITVASRLWQTVPATRA